MTVDQGRSFFLNCSSCPVLYVHYVPVWVFGPLAQTVRQEAALTPLMHFAPLNCQPTFWVSWIPVPSPLGSTGSPCRPPTQERVVCPSGSATQTQNLLVAGGDYYIELCIPPPQPVITHKPPRKTPTQSLFTQTPTPFHSFSSPLAVLDNHLFPFPPVYQTPTSCLLDRQLRPQTWDQERVLVCVARACLRPLAEASVRKRKSGKNKRQGYHESKDQEKNQYHIHNV